MKRKDEWSIEDDTLLTNTVLEYIKTGKTQLKAFDDVSEKLKRTSAACGFRWNSNVRHKHLDVIVKAKLIKLNRKSNKIKSNESLSIDSIISCLIKLKDDLHQTETEKQTLLKRIQDVSLEIESRRSEMMYDTKQNQQVLALLLSKAAELGLFEQNKKPAI
ncbi:RsfA family transcriptional regulator [Paenibacillus sp. QZ-Y1]|uniref:RsfA family transcriptional regulator n=1 Tax=Paenibacillus sp. QZ-Y1 TaxID=3414511 RepID=UPI003F7A6286